MGRFFEEVFLPSLKKLVEAGLSYDEVKRLVKIPSTWGAKISGEQFRERAKDTLRTEESNPGVLLSDGIVAFDEVTDLRRLIPDRHDLVACWQPLRK